MREKKDKAEEKKKLSLSASSLSAACKCKTLSHLTPRLFSSSEEVSDFAEWELGMHRTVGARPMQDFGWKPELYGMKLTIIEGLELVETAKGINTWFVWMQGVVGD